MDVRTSIPIGIIERLKSMPSVNYTIYPSDPIPQISTELIKNTSGTMSMIHNFTAPSGHYFIINPTNKQHYIKFHPRTIYNMYIAEGRMAIYHIKGRGDIIEVYKGPTGDVFWREPVIGLPGEQIETRFFHPYLELDERHSILEMGIEIKTEG